MIPLQLQCNHETLQDSLFKYRCSYIVSSFFDFYKLSNFVDFLFMNIHGNSINTIGTDTQWCWCYNWLMNDCFNIGVVWHNSRDILFHLSLMFLCLPVLYLADNQEAIFNPWCSSYTLMEWIRKKCNCDSDSKCPTKTLAQEKRQRLLLLWQHSMVTITEKS